MFTSLKIISFIIATTCSIPIKWGTLEKSFTKLKLGSALPIQTQEGKTFIIYEAENKIQAVSLDLYKTYFSYKTELSIELTGEGNRGRFMVFENSDNVVFITKILRRFSLKKSELKEYEFPEDEWTDPEQVNGSKYGLIGSKVEW